METLLEWVADIWRGAPARGEDGAEGLGVSRLKVDIFLGTGDSCCGGMAGCGLLDVDVEGEGGTDDDGEGVLFGNSTTVVVFGLVASGVIGSLGSGGSDLAVSGVSCRGD